MFMGWSQSTVYFNNSRETINRCITEDNIVGKFELKAVVRIEKK